MLRVPSTEDSRARGVGRQVCRTDETQVKRGEDGSQRSGRAVTDA